MHFSLAQITNGNPEAQYFLKCWGDYLRAIDDTIDESLWSPERCFHVFCLGNRLYSSNFYRNNLHMLQAPILTGTAMWQVSCEWEKKEQPLFKQQWADYLRHSDVAMLSAVALICKGWDSSVEFIRAFLCGAFIDHKDRHGLPAEKPIEIVSCT